MAEHARASASAPSHAAPSHAAPHAHGHGHAADDHHGHGHADAAGDKRAAFLGLVAGMLVIGAMMYGMVQWTNARFAGHGEGGARPAAEATR